MKQSLVATFLLLFVVLQLRAQEDNTIYLRFGLINTKDVIKTSTSGNALSNGIVGPNLGIGYNRSFNKNSGIEVHLGYSRYNLAYLYDLDQVALDTLSNRGLEWNNTINIPDDERYISLVLSYSYSYFLNDKNKLSLISGANLRLPLFKTIYREDPIAGGPNFMIENEDDIFQSLINERVYLRETHFKSIAINPNLSLRYERITKRNNTFGLSLDVNIPLFKIYENQMQILPDFPEVKSEFESFSRGGSVGITFFYGISFGREK